MDLKLLERFLSLMMPPKKEAKESVSIAFNCMRADTVTTIHTIGTMIGHLQVILYNGTDSEQSNACRHVLTGIMIAWASENEVLRKSLIEAFLEQMAKIQGENVINFHEKKAGR